MFAYMQNICYNTGISNRFFNDILKTTECVVKGICHVPDQADQDQKRA